MDQESTVSHLSHSVVKDEKVTEINDEAQSQLDQLEQQAGTRRRWWEYQFPSPTWATYTLAMFGSCGGLLSGVDQSLISGANLYMPKELNLTDHQASLVSSGVPLGAIAGSLMISPLNEWFGRRISVLISCVLYTVGAALEAGAVNYGIMISGRIILGAGLGLEGGTVPMYVAECVPSSVRGRLVSLYQFCIALGEVLGYAIAAMFVSVPGNWRYMLGSSLVFSTIMFIGVVFLPESPRWLMHKKREVDSWKVWKNLRGFDTEMSKLEFLEMRHTALYEITTENQKEKRMAWLDFFRVGRARRALIYCNIMMFLGQLTGINGIMYYMSTLMTQIGFSDKNAVFMSLVGGGSLLIGTIPAILYMDRMGRRTWAIFTLPGFFIGLVLVGISGRLTKLQAVEGTYLTGLILYQVFFGSYACLSWVLPSESYPTYLRSYGMTTSSASIFLWSFVVTYNFTSMQKAMTTTGLLLGFYGGIAVIGWIYQVLCMPETKNKTLEEIDDIFSMPTRQLIRYNVKSTMKTIGDIAHFRIRDAFEHNDLQLY
uniref:ARAD1D05016p n=1 Tax=Blastobotrys adeninivorans TaxID=409370 RepID=A0A060TE51_BLAAD